MVYPSKGVSELALLSHNMPSWCAASNAIAKVSLQPGVPVSTKSPCDDNCYYICSSVTALSSLRWLGTCCGMFHSNSILPEHACNGHAIMVTVDIWNRGHNRINSALSLISVAVISESVCSPVLSANLHCQCWLVDWHTMITKLLQLPSAPPSWHQYM